jgi:hypothetical protein
MQQPDVRLHYKRELLHPERLRQFLYDRTG